MTSTTSRCGLLLGLLFTALLSASAQMVTGASIPGFSATMGLEKGQKATAYAASFDKCSIPGNVLWPGDTATFDFTLRNTTDQPIAVTGKLEVIAYGTKGQPNDIWVPSMFRIATTGALPVTVNLPAKGSQHLALTPPISATFGPYALVLDLGAYGRCLAATCVRTFAASSHAVEFPHFCLDDMSPDILSRMGVQAFREQIDYKPTTDADFPQYIEKMRAKFDVLKKRNITIVPFINGGRPQPMNQQFRSYLNDQGEGKMDYPGDAAFLPSADADLTKYVRTMCREFGWPKGPITAYYLWNEPWEGSSIAGWGADMLRYREMYTALVKGVHEANAEDGVHVLVGGCDSTSNAVDKLFCDGKDTFLPDFDFVSIHYQGLDPHSTIKQWVDRKSPNGRVQIWDTESWVANCDDRVAAVVAADRAAGYDRAMGVFRGNISEGEQVWSVAASVGAVQHFIGERPFKEILFKNGLPWVFVFDGQPNTEDGTLVVVGDIGEEFGHDGLLFRTARSTAEQQQQAEWQKQLAALPANAPERAKLAGQLAAVATRSGATLTIAANGTRYSLFDFYGNPVPAQHGKIVIPLDGRGFFLHGNGKAGSFAAMVKAVQNGDLRGIEPLAKACHDLTAPIESHPTMRLTLTNVLNRPVHGTLSLTLGNLTLAYPPTLTFAANETKDVPVKIVNGAATANNTYHLALKFDAGKDGYSLHDEDMHCNLIAKRTITIDGKLDDWQGVLPQTVIGGTSLPTVTEAAWWPTRAFDTSMTQGFATGYLAYDDKNFYFACKAADDTPEAGMLRYETLDEDQFFYPKVSYRVVKDGTGKIVKREAQTWPDGVRQYSYRKDPDLPAGNFPSHDNVQIAFNVLPAEQKSWYPCPPGTMPGYIYYRDTDYEYALNPVAPAYGGGTEIWRMEVPGMPHKHFYPRQPKWIGNGVHTEGAVKDGQLVVTRDGNTRITECAIPWRELPDVKKALDAGHTIKFSFRVNNNVGGLCMELARQRSVAKRNGSFHVDWTEHWANEVEFGFQQ